MATLPQPKGIMVTEERPTALITGASRGIGRAIAVELSRTHHIIAAGRARQALDDLVGTLPSAQALQFDVTDTAQARTSFEAITRLDVLVHSAGVAAEAPFGQLTAEQWRESFDVNVLAVAELTRILLPALRAAKGLITFLNSGSGLFSYAEGAAYTGTKFALRALADCLREDERSAGVRVTSIHPGFVDTEMGRRLVAEKGWADNPAFFVPAEAVASCVRLAVDMPVGTQVEMLTIRPQLVASVS